jgi:two-component system cell cycle sensor histidine kinase/response regulator CckA
VDSAPSSFVAITAVKRFKKVERVQGVIILVSFLAFIMVSYSNWVTLNMFKRSERLDTLPETIQNDFSLSKFALEKALAGDTSIQLHRDIQRPLDEALSQCHFNSQAHDDPGGLLKPVDDRSVKAAVLQLTLQLDTLRKLSMQRFTNRNDPLERSRLEISYVKAGKELSVIAQSARTSLVELRNHERMVVNAISIGSVVILFGLFAGLIEFVMRQHRINKLLRIKQERHTAVRAEVGLALASNLPLRSVLESCAETLAMHFEAGLAQIWTLNPDGVMLELQTSAGRVGRAHQMEIRARVGQSRLGLIAKQRANYLATNLASDAELTDPAIKAEQMQSIAACPLLVENRLIGVMVLYSKEVLNDEALELMNTVSESVAHGIERKRAEKKISEQAALLDKARDAIICINLDNHCIYWNKSAERLYGIPATEALGKDAAQVLFTERALFDSAMEIVMQKGEWLGECAGQHRSGNIVTVESHWTLVHDDSGVPKSVLVVNTDVSEKKQFEAQLLRTQRVESIGTLAGGIAHDLNNVLAPVLMSVEMLRPKLQDEQSARMISILESSAKRGAQMVKQILTFARGAHGERMLLQPRQLIKEMARIAKETFPKAIQAQVKVQENLWAIMGDPTQLHQVLMNLAVNARDAMPNGGTLSFAAENVLLGEEEAKKHGAAKPGCYVMMSVTDTGSGISREILDKIFDPFFTTKEQGKGTGLGLSTVMGIVKGHKGFLQVQSEVNKGTQFKIFLPALETMAEQQREAEAKRIPKGQGELLLVVDDELPFLSMTKEALEMNGYRVLTAGDGVEAVAVFSAHRNEIKAVFTDMLMPHMDGPAVIKVLKRLDPSVRIVGLSGLMDADRVRAATGRDDIEVISKPFTFETLLTAVHDTLN